MNVFSLGNVTVSNNLFNILASLLLGDKERFSERIKGDKKLIIHSGQYRGNQ